MKQDVHAWLAVSLVALVPACRPESTATSQAPVEEALVRTVTIPAPEGSRGFGMPSTRPDTSAPRPRPRRPSASVTDTAREIVTTTLDEMNMSDPFVYADDATKTYYLTSSGGSIYTSKDLKNWTGPYGAYDVTSTWMGGVRNVAAAEIHHVNGKYYYSATFSDTALVDVVPRRYNINRHQTMILVSDKPEGPYQPANPDSSFELLPHNWRTIDGTIWYEDGVAYFVFCHEWLQVIDGTMEYAKLTPDLSKLAEKPTVMFRASEAPWALEMVGNGEMTYGLRLPGWVTDGPELFRTKTGKLGMLWSSWGAHRYAQGVAYSESGKIEGPWVQEPESLKGDNSGHGMMFTTFEGKRLLILHHVEGDGPRKPQLFEIDDSGDKLVLGPRYHP